MTWQERFDRLLKAMVQGEPHKAQKETKEIGPKEGEREPVKKP